MTGIPKKALAILAEFVRNYDRVNSVRTADVHIVDCECLRCIRDRAEAVINEAASAEIKVMADGGQASQPV